MLLLLMLMFLLLLREVDANVIRDGLQECIVVESSSRSSGSSSRPCGSNTGSGGTRVCCYFERSGHSGGFDLKAHVAAFGFWLGDTHEVSSSFFFLCLVGAIGGWIERMGEYM